MFRALKTISKKVLLLIIAIICLPIVILITIAIFQSCNNKTSYSGYESRMILSAKKYFKEKNLIPEKANESSKVLLKTLVSYGYIKSPEDLLGDSSCDGSVTVRKNGIVSNEAKSGKLNYTVELKCKDYNSNTLKYYMMKDLTENDSGLYRDGSYYVYKGDMPNNYLRFYNTMYRIMEVDSNNIVKLIKNESELATVKWDNKYNSSVDASYGKSIYKDSAILKLLIKNYNNKKIVSPSSHDHIVSYDVCIGKRSSADNSISRELDCSETLPQQYITLINLSDYARASLDPECNSISSKSCKNYNYLYNVIPESWTLNATTNNTYQVFYLSSSMPYLENANEHHSYNIVIYIDGNEIVKSGNGTLNNPYVIE